MTHESEDNLIVDTTLELDDELCNLFAAFDEVSASDELKDATLARILGRAGDTDESDAGEGDAGEGGDGPGAGMSAAQSASAVPSVTPAPVAGEVRAMAGGKTGKATRRAKWRAIRVAAIAACLALALSGGIAYATPAAYYEIEQDGTTITLGVNCFGITVDATSDSETGADIIDSAGLRNIPYEQSLTHAIEAMEERNPDKPVEYGPRGGERETVAPRDGGQDGATGQPDAGAPDGQAQPQGGATPEGGQAQPQGGTGTEGSQPQPQSQPQPDPQSPEASSEGASENQPASWPQGEEPGQGGEPPDRP